MYPWTVLSLVSLEEWVVSVPRKTSDFIYKCISLSSESTSTCVTFPVIHIHSLLVFLFAMLMTSFIDCKTLLFQVSRILPHFKHICFCGGFAGGFVHKKDTWFCHFSILLESILSTAQSPL